MKYPGRIGHKSAFRFVVLLVKLAELGWDPAFGARPLKRVIQRELGDALALAILEGSITDGSRVEVSPSDSGFAFTTTG